MIDVASLPRRAAHATFALMDGMRAVGGPGHMPLTADEISVYDSESSGATSTGAALRGAKRLGLVTNAGRYWIPTNAALGQYNDFEARYLRETEDEHERAERERWEASDAEIDRMVAASRKTG